MESCNGEGGSGKDSCNGQERRGMACSGLLQWTGVVRTGSACCNGAE